MAIFKCKMCGGTIEFEPSATVGVCDSCGTKQTLPRLDSDRKSNLYDRANHFRRNNDFDKAMGIYEQILNEDNTDAEAYWSLVLCRYGIEYVEDPATHKRIPTVNRAQYTSIYMDEDYKAALQYADVYQRQVYEEEAKTIDDIQKGILEISNKEKPFDVFICYKETDNNGRRTQDSVLANDLYHQLTQEGFKVFFSRITLEDKLGTAYEPYIFAALNSAKVMVVLGTKPEYFNAVWVKNEWSRYLSLVKKSNGKKMLIPAYRDMDPYDLPEEFSHLQAQDMSKLGFMQDLIRGIKKIIGSEPIQQVTQKSITAAPAYGSNVDALLKRGNMALEDHEWQKADNFFEEVLNQNAECSAAYLGKWMAAEKQTNLFMLFSTIGERFNKTETQTIEACPADNEHINYMIDHNQIPGYLERSEIRKQYDFDRTYQSDVVSRETQKNGLVDWLNAERLYTRALEYASESEKAKLEKNVTDLMQLMDDRIEKARRDAEENAYLIRENYKKHLGQADQYVHEIRQKAETEQEVEYQQIVQQKKEAKTISEYEKIKEKLNLMKGYKDTEVLANECQTEIERLQEEKRQEKERIQEKQRQADIKEAKKRKMIIIIICIAVVLCIGVVVVLTIVLPRLKLHEEEQKLHEEELRITTEELKMLQSAEIGSIVQYGTYNSIPLKWIVMDKRGTRLLLLSQNAIEQKGFYTSRKSTTWETSSLRGWLNQDFIDNAFSKEESAHITDTNVSTTENLSNNISDGNDMVDKLFLFSIDEVNEYFHSDQDRICYYKGESCWWWLRSPGSTTTSYNKVDLTEKAAFVNTNGSVSYDGNYVNERQGAVRPAMWIDVGLE